jgi:hypothetical protein
MGVHSLLMTVQYLVVSLTCVVILHIKGKGDKSSSPK